MVEELQPRISNGVNLLHAVPGRIRLRITGDSLKNNLEAIGQQLQQQEGIREVRTNEKTGSLLILFEPNKLSRVELCKFLDRCGISDIPGLSSEAKTAISWSNASSKACNRLKAFIPPIIGLLTVRSLRMYGWSAIVTYLIVTRITRLASKQLKLKQPEINQGKASQKTLPN